MLQMSNLNAGYGESGGLVLYSGCVLVQFSLYLVIVDLFECVGRNHLLLFCCLRIN